MMRVGILGHGFINWGGGIDFLRIVSSSLKETAAPMELHLLVPTVGPRLRTLNGLRACYRTAKFLLGRGTAPSLRHVGGEHIVELGAGALGTISLHEIDIGAKAIASAARRLSLDVILPAIVPLPSGFPVPWVGYIYDFQHRYLPQLFSMDECRKRDQQFTAMLARAPAVIVNARAVAADIVRFHANARARVFALPFSASPQPEWLAAGGSPAARYGIAKPYFIICNQFWKHKDHRTAFVAFQRLAAAHPDVDLVCTGSTADYRDPRYFETLQQELTRNGISERVHVLGMVPKADQIALLRGSIALIQPTLFEGGPGGGAVYDAVSLGVPSIVSDVEVNKEVQEASASFFRAGDAEDLARQMTSALSAERRPAPQSPQLLELGRIRRRRCGEVILSAIELAGA